MMFDGKISAVRMHDGHFLLYARANLKERGGRFVVVARSLTTAAWGEGDENYGDFELLSIEGYDRNGPGNLYFAAVDQHPWIGLFPGVLIGLFPVNRGVPGEGNGDGESFVALSFSCDGVHWSALEPLVWSVGLHGRTWDHPVDGLLLEEGPPTRVRGARSARTQRAALVLRAAHNSYQTLGTITPESVVSCALGSACLRPSALSRSPFCSTATSRASHRWHPSRVRSSGTGSRQMRSVRTRNVPSRS
eukprot:3042331-Prymnesium_polylepis.1